MPLTLTFLFSLVFELARRAVAFISPSGFLLLRRLLSLALSLALALTFLFSLVFELARRRLLSLAFRLQLIIFELARRRLLSLTLALISRLDFFALALFFRL